MDPNIPRVLLSVRVEDEKPPPFPGNRPLDRGRPDVLLAIDVIQVLTVDPCEVFRLRRDHPVKRLSVDLSKGSFEVLANVERNLVIPSFATRANFHEFIENCFLSGFLDGRLDKQRFVLPLEWDRRRAGGGFSRSFDCEAFARKRCAMANPAKKKTRAITIETR